MARGFTLCVVVTIMLAPAMAACQSPDQYHIMLVNDDGVDAPGIAAMAEVLVADPGIRLTVVAPLEQQSGMAHALIFKREVAVRNHEALAGAPTYSVDATPASATRMGVSAILAEDPPDLIVSGINRGENIGRIAWYSGTVGAAREAVMAGFSSVAFSLQLDWENPEPDFLAAARLAKVVVDAVRAHGLPPGVYLNVNIPMEPAQAKGYRLARMSLARDQLNRYQMVREEDGVRYYKSRWMPPDELEPGSDAQALRDGWVSLAPLHLDATDYEALPLLQGFELALPELAAKK